ncbi:MAG: Ku protein [Acidimicrobiia bacterium]
MAARPVWTGSITFGMVAIPVRLVSAVRRKSVSFHQLDSESMSRIKYRKVSEATGEEVPAERIVKAAEVSRGHYVVVTDEDLAPLAPAKAASLELEVFVPADEIDPVMFDASYHVLPDKAARPYALLAGAMAGTGRMGIGRLVMRQKEYLAAVRSDGDHLALSTLVFPDEVVRPQSLEDFEVIESVTVSDRELTMARSLVEAMSGEFDPSAYNDEYRMAVDALVERKAAGQPPLPVAAAPERAVVIDLAAALEASLAAASAAKRRHPSSRQSPAEKALPGEEQTAATKKPRKRTAARKSA